MYNVYRELYREHYEDMLRAARHDALVRQAEASQAPARQPAWQTRALAWCGEQLVVLGERLQAAACAEAAEPPSISSDHCAEYLA
jgi:hypothetical protein